MKIPLNFLYSIKTAGMGYLQIMVKLGRKFTKKNDDSFRYQLMSPFSYHKIKIWHKIVKQKKNLLTGNAIKIAFTFESKIWKPLADVYY